MGVGDCGVVQTSPRGMRRELSLEVQVPGLDVYLGESKVLDWYKFVVSVMTGLKLC